MNNGDRLGFRVHLLLALSLLLTVFLVGSATGVQRTVISIYASTFVASAVLEFLPVSVFGLLKGSVDIFGGFFSDKLGRRPTALAGLSIYVTGVSLLTFIRHYYAIILGNIFVGAGQGMLFAAAMIALSDIGGAREAGSSFGFMESFVYSGYGIGAVIAGWLMANYGIRFSFIYSLLASIVALLLAITLLKETKPLIKYEERVKLEKPLPTIQAYRLSLTKPSLVLTYAMGHIAKFVDALAWAAFPLLFQMFNYTAIEIGVLQGIMTFSWALSMPIWGRISDRYGRKKLVMIGLLLNSVSLLALLYSKEIILSSLATLLIGLSMGMYYPTLPAITVDVLPLEIKGRALGLYRSIRDYGYFTGALILGLIVKSVGFAPAFYVTSSLILVGSLLTFFFVRETRPSWPIYEMVLQHLELIRDCVQEGKEVLSSIANGDERGAWAHFKRAKDVEERADDLKRRIMDKIWSSYMSLSDKMDFERLIELIDKVAGCVLESSIRMIRVLKMGKVPDGFLKQLTELMEMTLGITDKFIEGFKALRLSPQDVFEASKQVEEMETDIDKVHSKLILAIRELKEVDLLAVIDLKESVELLENIADDFEDASDIIRIIAVKYGG